MNVECVMPFGISGPVDTDTTLYQTDGKEWPKRPEPPVPQPPEPSE